MKLSAIPEPEKLFIPKNIFQDTVSKAQAFQKRELLRSLFPNPQSQPLNPQSSMPDRPYSLQTANSLPLGSAKWKRRPPGNPKISRTIFPPAAVTLA